MGGKFGIFNDHGRRVGPVNLNPREYGILKKLWTEIENDPQKYSRGIYMRLFALFPRYMKYFVDEKSAPYEKFQRINDKFVRILSTIGYLIRDFYKKPKKFDSVVGYIAMVHQDMYLNVEDINNFSHAIIQYLGDVVPQIMTDECVIIFTDFMDDLTQQLVTRMVKGRAEMAADLVNRNHSCRWIKRREKSMYGHDQSYWISRRNQWKIKMQKWTETPVNTDPGFLHNLFNGSGSSTDDEKRRSITPTYQVTKPYARGSVMSEILQVKLWSVDENNAVYEPVKLRRKSSQNVQISRQSVTAVGKEDVSAGKEDPSNFLTPRDRFRHRRTLKDFRNEPSTSNNEEYRHSSSERDEQVLTRLAARQRRRGSSLENGTDKTDH